jgi:hypothetical protein
MAHIRITVALCSDLEAENVVEASVHEVVARASPSMMALSPNTIVTEVKRTGLEHCGCCCNC